LFHRKRLELQTCHCFNGFWALST